MMKPYHFCEDKDGSSSVHDVFSSMTLTLKVSPDDGELVMCNATPQGARLSIYSNTQLLSDLPC